MAKSPKPHDTAGKTEGGNRRDFLYVATGTVGAVGVAAASWPFIHQMNPSASVLALASTEVDLSSIEEGQAITVIWRGKPVFVRKRTTEEIELASKVDLSQLPHPETDTDRVQRPEWLVL